jgi:hypothetical protein
MRALSFFIILVWCIPASAEDFCTTDRYATCTSMIGKAYSMGVLKNDTSGGVSVFVNDRFWSIMDFQAKSNFARCLDCVGAKPGKILMSIQFRSMQTGKDIGKWWLGQLTVY